MTKKEVLVKAYEGRINWLQAADILGYTPRHLRRIRARYEQYDFEGLRDGRGGGHRRKRTPKKTIEKLVQLRRERYADFSMKHFHEQITEKHGLHISYEWTKQVLFAHSWRSGRTGEANTVGNGSDGRWWGCWSTRTRRRTSGWPTCRCRIWS